MFRVVNVGCGFKGRWIGTDQLAKTEKGPRGGALNSMGETLPCTLLVVCLAKWHPLGLDRRAKRKVCLSHPLTNIEVCRHHLGKLYFWAGVRCASGFVGGRICLAMNLLDFGPVSHPPEFRPVKQIRGTDE